MYTTNFGQTWSFLENAGQAALFVTDKYAVFSSERKCYRVKIRESELAAAGSRACRPNESQVIAVTSRERATRHQPQDHVA